MLNAKKNEGNKGRVNGKNIVQEGGINMYDDDRQGGKEGRLSLIHI
mgnify:CR=1 FL=1